MRHETKNMGLHLDGKIMNEETLADSGGVDLHWILSACAGVFLLVGSHLAGLPLRVDWRLFIGAFWGGMAVRAIFAATMLYLIGFPLSQTVRPFLVRYKQQKARIPALAIFALWMLLQ